MAGSISSAVWGPSDFSIYNMLGFGSSAQNPSAFLAHDAAQTIGQRNGANPQKSNTYLTYTSATVFERLSLDAGKATANVARVMMEVGGSGGTIRPIAIDGYAKPGAMIAADIPQGTWALFKDTSGGSVVLGYNDGGTLKTVSLS